MEEQTNSRHGSVVGEMEGKSVGASVGLLLGVIVGEMLGETEGAPVYCLQPSGVPTLVSSASISNCDVLTPSACTHNSASASQPHERPSRVPTQSREHSIDRHGSVVGAADGDSEAKHEHEPVLQCEPHHSDQFICMKTSTSTHPKRSSWLDGF